MSARRVSCLSLVLVVAACLPLAAAGRTAGKAPRIVMVIAPMNFTDREYVDPRAVFDAAGAAVVVASTTTQTATGHDGLKVKPQKAIRDVHPDQFDALVLVGGLGAIDYLLKSQPLKDLLAAARDGGKVVAAVCVAPAVLAAAGVLKGCRATCYPDKAIVGMLASGGAVYVDQDVVTSGRIVTGSGPESARQFAVKVLALLQVQGEQ